METYHDVTVESGTCLGYGQKSKESYAIWLHSVIVNTCQSLLDGSIFRTKCVISTWFTVCTPATLRKHDDIMRVFWSVFTEDLMQLIVLISKRPSHTERKHTKWPKWPKTVPSSIKKTCARLHQLATQSSRPELYAVGDCRRRNANLSDCLIPDDIRAFPLNLGSLRLTNPYIISRWGGGNPDQTNTKEKRNSLNSSK